MTEAETNKIETWAVVEIMGHQQLAGFAVTTPFGGTVMLRVDVPDLPERKFAQYGEEYIAPAEPGFTQYIGMGSIYRLTPCTEEFAREAASKRRRLAPRPLSVEQPVGALTDGRDQGERDLPGEDDETEYGDQ